MLRFRVRELIADKSFRDGNRVTITSVAEATGINRRVLTSIINERGYNTGTDNVDRLCRFFECQPGEVMQYVPDEHVAQLTAAKKAKQS